MTAAAAEPPEARAAGAEAGRAAPRREAETPARPEAAQATGVEAVGGARGSAVTAALGAALDTAATPVEPVAVSRVVEAETALRVPEAVAGLLLLGAAPGATVPALAVKHNS